MSVTPYPTLRLKLTMPQALKLQFLPAIPGSNAAAAAADAQAAADAAQAAANTAVAATANKVDKSGDVMTGFLTLNANPTANLHAATKQYVDAHAGGGGNVSNVGTPTNLQIAQWTDATHIQGINISSLGLQPLDADLTSIAGATVTNQWLYRSGTDTWSPVTIGANLTFTGGTLAATGGGGGAPVGAEYVTSTADATLTNERVLTDTATITWDRTTAGQIKANTAAGGGNVSNSGTPALDQVGIWVTATTIKGIGGTANQVLRIASAGTTPSFGAIDVSQAAAVTGRLAFANLTQGSARSVLGVTGNATADVAIIQGAADQVLRVNGAGTALAFGMVATGGIADNAVTYIKMQDVSAASLLIGRGSAAGAGDPQEITLGTNLSMAGTTLNATGGGASISISDTPPGSPTAGSMWWESDTGTLWIYYTDANTSQWVAAAGAGAMPGALVQHVYTENATWMHGSTGFAAGGNNVPQVTDGTQILSASITPLAATNKLNIRVSGTATRDVVDAFIVALFKTGTSAAVAGQFLHVTVPGVFVPFYFEYEVAAGSTSAQTYTARIMRITASGEWAINGSASSGPVLGGTSRSVLTIDEIKA
jgi:hypothetical protein